MKNIVVTVILTLCGEITFSQTVPNDLPHVTSGTVYRHPLFTSQFVAARNIDVWLPEGYITGKKYPVLYMQDGQMLFDSTTTWNKTEWHVDETVSKLIKDQNIIPCIVVAIWNAGVDRHSDYLPQKPFESIPVRQQDSIYAANTNNGQSLFSKRVQSDNYLKFLVTELKPFIDRTYSTMPGQRNTFIAGSSMGGLISIYAICEYPHVFGGAACISTHWPGVFTLDNNPISNAMLNYLSTHLPSPTDHKIYFDNGTATLDAMYPALQQKVDRLMKSKGYTSANWVTKEFPGADHSEKSWSERFSIPMEFLFKK